MVLLYQQRVVYNRTVSMSSISSYSLEGIEVIKSPTADMVKFPNKWDWK